MSNIAYHLKLRSKNEKTGPIPVSTTSHNSCPTDCPFYGNGCYAELGHLAMFWRKVGATVGTNFDAFCDQIAALPDGQLWRHNQAGDLPGQGNEIDAPALAQLAAANAGKHGFTYTHKPPHVGDNAAAIRDANAAGFTINLSGNSLAHADQLAELAIGPVVVVLPSDHDGKTAVTPRGRKVAVCPATYMDTNCKACGLCARQDRKVIVGFPAHGISKKKVDAIVGSTTQ